MIWVFRLSFNATLLGMVLPNAAPLPEWQMIGVLALAFLAAIPASSTEALEKRIAAIEERRGRV